LSDFEGLGFAEIPLNDDFDFVEGGFSSIANMRRPAWVTA
jgi:hypothetical protein